MKVQLTYEIRLASDYHVGAGYGAGFGIDSALLRDGDGVPVLRGTALAGLLRDSLDRLLQTPALAPLDASTILERLFGSPQRLKRWHISSARPTVALEPLRRRAWGKMRDAQAVQRVRINPRTRRAEAGKLFSNEEGDSALRFQFTATCYEDGEAARHDAALMTAAARNLRSLGRSRRRGSGVCTLHLVAVEGLDLPAGQEAQAALLEQLRTVWLPGKQAPLLQQTPGSAPPLAASLYAAPAAGSQTPATTRLRVVLRLDEPLIVAERSPAGNQFRSKTTINGGVLLGALASLAARRLDLDDPAQYHTFAQLFLAGGVRCSALHFAYEQGGSLYATAPAPHDWLTCKTHPFTQGQAGHGVFAPTRLGGPDRCPECQSALESVSGLVVLKPQDPYTAGPQAASELHIRINPASKRVAAGDLYGYTALTAGQYFLGELDCGEDGWQTLQAALKLELRAVHHLRLGKAQRRGYGAVTLWLEELPADPLPIAWAQRKPDLSAPVAITLLSETIAVDGWGRQLAGFAAGWLEKELGLGPLEIVEAAARRVVVDGFNAWRGLPRWRGLALDAGSTVWVRFQAPPPDWEGRMRALERAGVGERRSEGYGRIAFNYLHGSKREHVETLREGCAAVLTLDGSMSLTSAAKLAAAARARTFEQSWNAWLAGEMAAALRVQGAPNRFREMGEALARHLQAQSGGLPLEVAGALGALGQAGADLQTAVGGAREYGARRKENYFAGDGKLLLCAAQAALAELAEQHDPALWPLGIRSLAAAIAQNLPQAASEPQAATQGREAR